MNSDEFNSYTLLSYDINKNGQGKEDAIFQLKPYIDTESKLVAAPVCLSIVGVLNLIATSGNDFALYSDEKNTFTFLKWPNSFRASLYQVSNSVSTAFRYSHKNMDFIRLSMKRVPGHLSDALQLLTEGNAEEISDGLPIDLGQITSIGNLCRAKVEEVVKFYDLVIQELNELTEATLQTKGVTEEARQKTKALMDANDSENKLLESEQARLREENEKIRKQLDEETTEFKSVLSGMGNWKSIARQISAVAIDTTVNTVVPGLIMSYGVSSIAKNASDIESAIGVGGMLTAKFLPGVINTIANVTTGKQEAAENPDQFEEQELIGRAQELKKVVQNLSKSFENDTTLDQMALKDQELLNNAKTSLDFQMKKINHSTEGKPKKNLLKVCQKIKKLIAGIEKAFETKDPNVIDLHGDCHSLIEKCTKLGDAKTKSSLFPIPSPSLLNAAKQAMTKGNSNLSESFAKEMQLKLELTKEQLRSTEKRADELKERQLKTTRELHQTLSDLARFRETKATQDQVLMQIGKGLVAFGQLKKQWTDLLQFFDGMATLVNTTLGPRLQQFVDVAEAAEKRGQKGKMLANITRQRLFKPAYEAVKVAFIVEHLSTTYWMISDKHLMPMVSSFGEMISLSDKKEIEAKQRSIEFQAKKATDEISEFIKTNHDQFAANVRKRQLSLDSSFEKYVPKILPQEEVQKIQEFAREAIQNEEEESEDYQQQYSF